MMFRPMRREKRAISNEAAERLLANERRGVLAVLGDDGYPYAIPLNYLYDAEKGKIYFHGAGEGQKADAVRACDKVCFTVYGNEMIKKETWAPYVQSVVVFGRCHILEDREETLVLVKRIAMKYFPEESIADAEIAASGKRVQVYVIDIEHMTGKEIHER